MFDRKKEVLGEEVVEVKFPPGKFTNYRTSDIVFNGILSSFGAPEEAIGSGAVLEPSSSTPTIPKKFPNSGENTRRDQPPELEESAVDLVREPVRWDVELPSVHLVADAMVEVRRVLL